MAWYSVTVVIDFLVDVFTVRWKSADKDLERLCQESEDGWMGRPKWGRLKGNGGSYPTMNCPYCQSSDPQRHQKTTSLGYGTYAT
jgi:hypothetical protein